MTAEISARSAAAIHAALVVRSSARAPFGLGLGLGLEAARVHFEGMAPAPLVNAEATVLTCGPRLELMRGATRGAKPPADLAVRRFLRFASHRDSLRGRALARLGARARAARSRHGVVLAMSLRPLAALACSRSRAAARNTSIPCSRPAPTAADSTSALPGTPKATAPRHRARLLPCSRTSSAAILNDPDCAPWQCASGDPFVRRVGASLVLRDQPFRFVGANAWGVAWGGCSYGAFSSQDAALAQTFGDLSDMRVQALTNLGLSKLCR